MATPQKSGFLLSSSSNNTSTADISSSQLQHISNMQCSHSRCIPTLKPCRHSHILSVCPLTSHKNTVVSNKTR